MRYAPVGEAYRGMENYSPADVQQKDAPPPSVLSTIFVSLRDAWHIRRLPLVADSVVRGDGRQGWHLRVESCRPKPEWICPRTICFEERLYRVDAPYEAKPPRPFGYQLSALPPNEAARGILAYSPDEPLSGK